MKSLLAVVIVVTPLLLGELATAQERPPPPAPEQVDPEGTEGEGGFDVGAMLRGLAAAGEQQVLGWHRALAQRMSPDVAWGVLFAPPSLLMLLLMALQLRRHRLSRRETARIRATAAAPVLASKRTAAVPMVEAVAPSAAALRPAAARELTRAERILVTVDGDAPSLHENWVIHGGDDFTLKALRRAAAAELDANIWATAVAEAEPARLAPLRRRFAKEVAMQRVLRLLRKHPLVIEPMLEVSAPELLEVEEVESLALVRSDGLGAQLDGRQQLLLGACQSALHYAFAHADDPYLLIAAARDAELPALLSEHPADGSVYYDEPDAYQLALLLHGLAALDHRGPSFDATSHAVIEEFRTELGRYRRAVKHTIPAEGPACYAITVIGGGRLAGIGTLFAWVAGAADSASNVLIKISKLAAEAEVSQQRAMVALGSHIARALDDHRGGDREILLRNVTSLLGRPRLEAERNNARRLLEAAHKRATRRPLWTCRQGQPDPPDIALAEAHGVLVEHALAQLPDAERRLLEALDQLAYPGKNAASRGIATRRLGYVFAGLGYQAVRDTSHDLLASARAAAIAVEE